jgi:hypothetical protein
MSFYYCDNKGPHIFLVYKQGSMSVKMKDVITAAIMNDIGFGSNVDVVYN